MDPPPIPTEAPEAPRPLWAQVDHIFQYCAFLLANLPTHTAPYNSKIINKLTEILERLHTVMHAAWDDLFFMRIDHVLGNHLNEFLRLDPWGYIADLQLLLPTKDKDKSESNNEGKGNGEGNTEDKCDNDNDAKGESSNEGNGEENDKGNDAGNGASSNESQRGSDGEGDGDGDKQPLFTTAQLAALNTKHTSLTTTLAGATALFPPADDHPAWRTLHADIRITYQWSQREILDEELTHLKHLQRYHDSNGQPAGTSPASGQRLGQVVRELAALPKIESLLAGASPARRAYLANSTLAKRPHAVACTCSPSCIKW